MMWHRDQRTEEMAGQFPFPIHQTEPAPQPLGVNFSPTNWNHRTLREDWPPGLLRSDPDQIVQLFGQERYLEALAMTVSWGAMRRQAPIYGDRELPAIESALRRCAQSIQETDQLQDAWLVLTGEQPECLAWSAVIASKTLHFLSRSLYPQDTTPPVPRDGLVSLGYAWTGWVAHIPPAQRPQSWHGNTFDAYNRYMTAILVWAEQRHWTTTQIETTIFHERAG
jgi:hypothetical protein